MGKRSNFTRRAMDAYQTPAKPVQPVLPFLRAEGIVQFAEPCSGEGRLIAHLEAAGFECVYDADITDGCDALDLTAEMIADADAIITNPPWTRALMHPLLWHFLSLGKPVWLLFDSDWAHNVQAVPFLPHCSHMVSIGRVRWMEGTKHSGKDNCCWYRFDQSHSTGPHMYGRQIPHQLDALGEPPTIDRGVRSRGNFMEVA
jgi:hypothetical protein